MDPLQRIGEQRFQEANDAGRLDDYPGKGEPLDLEDLSGIDPDTRQAYMVLKGHGYVSEASQLSADIVSVHTLIAACRDAEERERLTDEQRRLRLRYAMLLESRGVPIEVIEQLLRKLEARG